MSRGLTEVSMRTFVVAECKIACSVSAVVVSRVVRAVLDSEREMWSACVNAGAALMRAARVKVNRMMNRGVCIVTHVQC